MCVSDRLGPDPAILSRPRGACWRRWLCSPSP
ncbi:MAG: hypothetical protein QOG57_467, partial [Pseudonocardiales bacterium]|nr:hypothetical protein [Pseudonocardiales bacterium]